MEKITNVTKGTDPARVQENKPAFFVSWLQDGQQQYQFFPLCFSMYTAFDRLKFLQDTAGKLEPWEVIIITAAFDKYFGLRSGVSDPELQTLFVDALAEKTGMRVAFLKDHLKEIQTI